MVSIVPVRMRFDKLRRRPRAEIKHDLDQAHFLIGAAVPNSGVSIREELGRGTFALRPSVPSILRWIAAREPDTVVRDAATRAVDLIEAWRAEQQTKDKGECEALQPHLFEM